AERLPFRSTVAEVIGLDASSWFRTITVNRGSERGVELNAPVIAPGGLVGRVVAVGARVARVQLLSDRDCAVGALLVRTRIRGIVSGAGQDELEMKYVNNLEDVVPGDLVVTSGMDAIYPKGIAIGRVATVRKGPRLFKIITLEAAASLDRLEEVFVLSPVGTQDLYLKEVDAHPR
ncbi:MAG: rod shape-determining protein MreC, partial [Acidobacteriota bacterium]